jgi:hypothetical protein
VLYYYYYNNNYSLKEGQSFVLLAKSAIDDDDELEVESELVESVKEVFSVECKGQGGEGRQDGGGLSTAADADEKLSAAEFDWPQFGEMLKPYWAYLLVSVAVSSS